MSAKTRLLTKLRELISLDLRSLALMRILVSGLIITDLITRASELEMFYTDKGVLPRNILASFRDVSTMPSVHMLSGDLSLQVGLFIVAGLAALLLMIGYKTRAMTLISWLLLVSLHNRNPIILQGGDIVFRLVLFWANFLPWGRVWSVDSFLSKPKKVVPKMSIANAGTFAYILQILMIYVFSAVLKTGAEWRTEGSAVYYALSIDHFRTHLGALLLFFPELMKVLTFGVLYFEAVGPFFYFFPLKTGWVRTILVFMFICMHIGFGLTMRLGPFPFITAFAWIGLLPSQFWEGVIPKLKSLAAWLTAPQRVNTLTRGLQSALKPRNIIEYRSTGLRKQVSKAWTILSPLRLSFYTVTVVFLLAVIIIWNLRSIDWNISMPSPVSRFMQILRIDQYWNMFAPYPLKGDGWFVVVGTLSDRSQVDLFKDGEKGAEVSWDKPGYVAGTYRNERWRKYMMNMWNSKYVKYRPYYLFYICDEWARDHPSQNPALTKVELYYMLEMTQPDFTTPEPQKILLSNRSCHPANL